MLSIIGIPGRHRYTPDPISFLLMSTSRVQPPASSTAAAPSRLRPLSRAFTLVELLLVISIIAILVSITIPALGSSRETSRRLKCLTNLKGIGVGFAVYITDSKELLPEVSPLQNPGAQANDPALFEVLSQYLDVPQPEREDPSNPDSSYTRVSEVYKCPSDRTGRDATRNFEPVWRSFGFSYQYPPGEFMWAFGQSYLREKPKAQQGVSLAWRQPQWRDLPILTDYDDWHTARRGGVPRNALYLADWSADWAKASPVQANATDPRFTQLICDIARYGGGRVPGCD